MPLNDQPTAFKGGAGVTVGHESLPVDVDLDKPLALCLVGAVRFHDIRHTCVSLLLDLGVPPHVVREIVGHSDIEVTMTIYAHAALDEKRKALGKLGDALG